MRESVLDRGKVLLRFSFERTLLLINVFHILAIWKNLVSGDKLNKAELYQLIELYYILISRKNNYLGRAYSYEGMFKLNLVPGKRIVSKFRKCPLC